MCLATNMPRKKIAATAAITANQLTFPVYELTNRSIMESPRPPIQAGPVVLTSVVKDDRVRLSSAAWDLGKLVRCKFDQFHHLNDFLVHVVLLQRPVLRLPRHWFGRTLSRVRPFHSLSPSP